MNQRGYQPNLNKNQITVQPERLFSPEASEIARREEVDTNKLMEIKKSELLCIQGQCQYEGHSVPQSYSQVFMSRLLKYLLKLQNWGLQKHIDI